MKCFSLLFLFLTISITSYCQSKTYYGYKEKDASSQVNYAEVGKDLSNTLNEALRAREANLKANGWSSEKEYLQYKRFLKIEAKFEKDQERLKRKFIRGDKQIGFKVENGKLLYFKK